MSSVSCSLPPTVTYSLNVSVVAICALRQKGPPPSPGDGSKPSPVTVGVSAARTLVETANRTGAPSLSVAVSV